MRYLLEQEELFDYLSSQGATYGYARTSSDNQIDNFSIPGQGDNIRDFAKRKGLNLRRIIVDEAKSGKNMQREGLQYFLNHVIKEEKVEALVVNTLNRLARNSYHIHMIKDILEQHGVKLFVIEGGLSTENASSRLLFNMIGAFDEYDGENIVFQAKQGSIKRAELGLHNGNRVLGYNNVETEYGVKMLQINPEESKIVKQIYDLYERGHGMRAIANRLNQEGHRTKRGNLFSTTSIRDILDRELYRGNISYNENENYRVKGRSKTSENHVLTQGQHEAIVSNEQWEHVQYLRKKNSFHPNKTRPWGAILTGLLVCPQCGSKMTISNSSTKNKAGEVIKRRYYVCSQFKSKGRTACKANGVRVEVIEDLVKQGLNEIITYPEVLQQTVAFTLESMEEQKESLKRQLLEIEEEISQIQQSITRLESVIEKAPEAKVDIEKRIFTVQKDLSVKKIEHEIVLEKIDSMHRSINAESVSECMIFINKAMNGLEHEALKAVYHTFIERIDYDKASKKATIKVKISKQILEKINEYSKNKASIPDCGIDAFSLFIYI